MIEILILYKTGFTEKHRALTQSDAEKRKRTKRKGADGVQSTFMGRSRNFNDFALRRRTFIPGKRKRNHVCICESFYNN